MMPEQMHFDYSLVRLSSFETSRAVSEQIFDFLFFQNFTNSFIFSFFKLGGFQTEYKPLHEKRTVIIKNTCFFFISKRFNPYFQNK